jgi:acyl-CoA thioester hydrolase
VVANLHRFRVYYGDTDMAGIVYYANYLRWFEAGRSELIKSLGISYRSLSDTGRTAPVTSASLRYLAPARYEDELELETKVEETRQVSFRISYRLVRLADGVLVCTGETTHACVDEHGKLTRLPPAFRAALAGQP